MAARDRRLERHLRYVNHEFAYCQSQARRHQTRCQELEERVRRNADRAKAYEERALSLDAERKAILAQLEQSEGEPEVAQRGASEDVPEETSQVTLQESEEKQGQPPQGEPGPEPSEGPAPPRFHGCGSPTAILYPVVRP
jgi:uncharacterized membrane protein